MFTVVIVWIHLIKISSHCECATHISWQCCPQVYCPDCSALLFTVESFQHCATVIVRISLTLPSPKRYWEKWRKCNEAWGREKRSDVELFVHGTNEERGGQWVITKQTDVLKKKNHTINMGDKQKIEICYKSIYCFVSGFHAVYLLAEGIMFFIVLFFIVLVTQMYLVLF